MSKETQHKENNETYRKNKQSQGNIYALKQRQVVGSNTGQRTGNN